MKRNCFFFVLRLLLHHHYILLLKNSFSFFFASFLIMEVVINVPLPFLKLYSLQKDNQTKTTTKQTNKHQQKNPTILRVFFSFTEEAAGHRKPELDRK